MISLPSFVIPQCQDRMPGTEMLANGLLRYDSPSIESAHHWRLPANPNATQRQRLTATIRITDLPPERPNRPTFLTCCWRYCSNPKADFNGLLKNVSGKTFRHVLQAARLHDSARSQAGHLHHVPEELRRGECCWYPHCRAAQKGGPEWHKSNPGRFVRSVLRAATLVFHTSPRSSFLQTCRRSSYRRPFLRRPFRHPSSRPPWEHRP